MTTVRITTESLRQITETVKKLNARAKRLKLAEIVLTTKPAAPLMVFKFGHDGKVVLDAGDTKVAELHKSERHKFWGAIETVELTVLGEGPKLAGWRLIATLEPSGDGATNIVRAVIGEDVGKQYRHDLGRCDHCKKHRSRKETFVVQHDDGTQKVVGRNCIADFLGHKDINALANYAARLAEFAASLGQYLAMSVVNDDDFYGSGSAPEGYELATFLDMCIRCCRLHGWTSAGAARDGFGGIATKDRAVSMVNPPPHGSSDRAEWQAELARLKAVAITVSAETVIAWAQTIEEDTDSDYLFNLRTIAHAGYVTRSTAGYAASMYVAYNNAMERETERQRKEARPDSQHVGAVGDRIELTVTVEKIHEFEGSYGVVGIHKMTDENGNDITWFASGKNWLDDDGVKTYRIAATVKNHGEYNGRLQTLVTRVKVLETVQ